ncbi:uncharacterized protein LOC120844031 [Ixodes scapularis]|uniref:uncharacterized protein LOC120844031 n=1 Tax=Ixodes scapularis TaxID=6945 RepID=UPI001A9F2E8E|nr:uncharacterized protein LOC120844031 [Ixodes scapularis]
MTRNQKMIAVLLVLFLHFLQITSGGGPIITGDFGNLAPQCEEFAKTYIKALPDLKEAKLRLRYCDFSYVRQTATGQRIVGEYALPNGFPCAFGATCYDGACKCSECE